MRVLGTKLQSSLRFVSCTPNGSLCVRTYYDILFSVAFSAICQSSQSNLCLTMLANRNTVDELLHPVMAYRQVSHLLVFFRSLRSTAQFSVALFACLCAFRHPILCGLDLFVDHFHQCSLITGLYLNLSDQSPMNPAGPQRV